MKKILAFRRILIVETILINRIGPDGTDNFYYKANGQEICRLSYNNLNRNFAIKITQTTNEKYGKNDFYSGYINKNDTIRTVQPEDTGDPSNVYRVIFHL
ncbi:MAG: hypothetical protein ACLSWM_07000 [Barnesiella sp.]|uniref:hypothetical protein n=1 Tax=Barnesiella propionica TaxID=2981781 RepID=UPI0011CC72F4|nr:hypothetical protein [Barnesiella propionica]MBO1735437.1 hypothetical protein [Barnesiella sp. GGCC_0306]MBS7040445.1 hypothetical protein [Bacteroidales bacterium]MCU6770005.1 hypothetical protein [Barnesiella propionica]